MYTLYAFQTISSHLHPLGLIFWCHTV